IQPLVLSAKAPTYSVPLFDNTFSVMNGDKYYHYFHGSSLGNKFLKSEGGHYKLVNKKFPFNSFHAVTSRQNCFDITAKEKFIEIAYGGGLYAFCKGKNYHNVDQLGLSDPLTSRLRVFNQGKFIPGHNIRAAPAGYFESIRSGQNMILDKDLRDYYERIRTVTQSEGYFNMERLKAIFYLSFVKPTYGEPYLVNQ
ncbi:hypothetical protein N9E24_01770, partial [Alphaproteobacteria bacterium]|nr:hypothetical protein [Alphaproteobacteria bacterium]